LFVIALSGLLSAFAQAAPLRLATFRSDVTPPIGHPLNGGFSDPVVTVEDGLEAKGIVLDDGRGRYVLCAVDWCGLSNTCQAMFQRKIAQAAGTAPTRVAVHCLHLHTAVLADGYANEMLARAENPIAMYDEKFLDDVTDRLASAVKASLDKLEPFDRIGAGQARVDRVASSRRIIVDGKFHARMSATKDPQLQALPEGNIDPMLKTVTLALGDRPLVRLHYYATHPQSFYGDGRVSSDVPGMARKRLETKENVFHIYFTGCGANVAMGKYNDGTPRARAELTDRLLAGMEAAIAATRFAPAEQLVWRTEPALLPLRQSDRYTVEGQQAVLANPKANRAARIEAAEYLAFARRIEEPIVLSSLGIGEVHLVHLPGEAFVEYQLFAQSVLPGHFVAVAAYGEYDPVYICTAKAFDEGGYEPTEAMSGPGSEAVLQKAIRRLLGVGTP
jgi:hypothetical protein